MARAKTVSKKADEFIRAMRRRGRSKPIATIGDSAYVPEAGADIGSIKGRTTYLGTHQTIKKAGRQ